MIQKLLIDAAVKFIAKKFKLDKVLSYVEDDNELDNKVKDLDLDIHELKARIKRIEKSI